MKLIMELMELALYDIVQIATVALELFGIAVLVFTAVKCFIRWLRKDHDCSSRHAYIPDPLGNWE